MTRLTWWFRIVGLFYLLLGVGNVYSVLSPTHAMYEGRLPFPADGNVMAAFVQGWSPFAFELVAIGTFLLWASREPRRYRPVVWLIAWMELWHGIIDDLYLISQGWEVVGYAIFIGVHVLIIVTGLLFVRQASAQTATPTA